ncbi:Hypothetical protein HVR_LOCUS630 [uncultured virus]|nr:Hypothetical protein HVR_LOCUS630 [uncultured virus]
MLTKKFVRQISLLDRARDHIDEYGHLIKESHSKGHISANECLDNFHTLNQMQQEISNRLNRIKKELEEIDVEYDYYEFETPKAQELFVKYCDSRGVSYEHTRNYSAVHDDTVYCIRVPLAAFTDVVINSHPNLDGDISHDITEEFMISIGDSE